MQSARCQWYVQLQLYSSQCFQHFWQEIQTGKRSIGVQTEKRKLDRRIRMRQLDCVWAGGQRTCSFCLCRTKRLRQARRNFKENRNSPKSDRSGVKSLIFKTLQRRTCPDESLKFRILACALGLLAKLSKTSLESMRNEHRLCVGAILQIAIGMEATSHNMKQIEERCWNNLKIPLQRSMRQKDTLAIFKSVVINAAWGTEH